MSPIFLIFACVLIGAQVFLPKRLAFVPLLISACHMGNAEFIGELTLPRLLIIIGILRAIFAGHFRWSISNPIDVAIFVFAVAAMLTAGAHKDAGFNMYVSNAGLVLNVCGCYLYGRCFFQSSDWPYTFSSATVIILVPLAVLLAAENVNGRNYYSMSGITGRFSSGRVIIRDGDVRARGPFRHPILTGTAGAACFPLCFILWRRRRKFALVGAVSCVVIAFASASSGPIAALLAVCGLMWCWKRRHLVPKIKYLAVVGIIFLSLYMERPIYYIIDSIDFTGGSTGWHRARLIEKGLNNLDEWWLAGTDYTRHWMASGVSWNPNHTDITNYYLHLGVIGGLPLTLTLIFIIWTSFKFLLKNINLDRDLLELPEVKYEFTLWCLGAALFAHAISFVSISYFDQMYVLFYLLVGAISGVPVWLEENGQVLSESLNTDDELDISNSPFETSEYPAHS